jgi:hypothetical protein
MFCGPADKKGKALEVVPDLRASVKQLPVIAPENRPSGNRTLDGSGDSFCEFDSHATGVESAGLVQGIGQTIQTKTIYGQSSQENMR